MVFSSITDVFGSYIGEYSLDAAASLSVQDHYITAETSEYKASDEESDSQSFMFAAIALTDLVVAVEYFFAQFDRYHVPFIYDRDDRAAIDIHAKHELDLSMGRAEFERVIHQMKDGVGELATRRADLSLPLDLVHKLQFLILISFEPLLNGS
jgi:hypothetical protein